MELLISKTDLPSGPYLVEAEGEIDIATVNRLEAVLRDAIVEGHRPILLDLGRCSYMDSTGLRAVLSAHKALRADDDESPGFAVVVAQSSLIKLFELTRLDQAVRIVPSREAGILLLDGAGTLTAGPRSSVDRASDF